MSFTPEQPAMGGDNIYQTTGASQPAYSTKIPASGQTIQVICPTPRRSNPLLWICILVLLLGGIGFLFMAMILGAIVQFAGEESPLPERYLSGNREATSKVLVLKIEGVIRGGEETFVRKQIAAARKDKNIKAVVLRIDSPGGTISGSDEYLHLLRKMKDEHDIPIVVSMGSLAASGGYYVAMAGDVLFAEPTTVTGSIGVIVPLFNVAKMTDNLGFVSTPIVSGPHKAMGSITTPMSDEEKKIWQDYVDEGFARFKEVIRTGRPHFATEEGKKELDALATGQIYTATQAEKLGLIDQIGYLDEAIEEAKIRAGVTDCKVIRYHRTPNLADALIGESNADAQAASSFVDLRRSLADLAIPRAYYIMPQTIPLGNE